MKKSKATKKNAARKVKRVKMAHDHVVKVELPKDHVPVVATHHEIGVIEIVPVPKAHVREKSWWERNFG